MLNLLHDIQYAARMLRRDLGFTAVAVLALALGVGANTAVFTVVNGVLLRPLPFPDPGRLFLLSYEPRHSPFQFEPALADRDYLEFRQRDRLFERTAVFTGRTVTLTGAGDPSRLPAASVTPDFFPTLRVHPAIGRAFLPGGDQAGHVALLSDRLWRSRFGADPAVVGRRIMLDGTDNVVAGVMPAGFTFPYDAELWTPLAIRIDPHNSMALPAVGRLRPGASEQQAQAELESITRGLPRFSGEDRSDWVARIVPLKELLVGDIRKSLLIFAGAVAFVLLIACANVANLLLMRAASRRHEVAVRTALGAGRWRLIRQLLTESTLVSLCGGAAGMLLAVWGVPLLLALAPAGTIPRLEQIHIDEPVLAFTFGVSVLTGIIFGLAPALQATRRELRESLSQGGRTQTEPREVLRGALAASEIALALILLTGAGLMLKSFLRMRAVNPGFRPENVLTVTVDLPDSVYATADRMRSFHERTLARLATLPGVVAAGAVNWRPLGGLLMMGDFQLEGGRPLPPDYMVDKPSVSPNYFRAMGIPLLRGRDFSERDDAAAPGVVIISESVARRFWPGGDAAGKRIAMDDHPKPQDWLTIVGVVADIRQQALTKKPDPAIYRPYLQTTHPFFLSHMTFAVRTASDPRGLAAAMRSVLREVDRDLPVDSIATMEDLVATTTTEPLFQTRLLAAFSMLALALAAIGIYGVMAYSVAQRTHEIGIRMALGAGRTDVLRMVLRHTLALAGAGVALGTAGALAVTRVLASLLFEVKPTDGATLMVVAMLLAAVAVFAASVPARRATKVDPLVALRYE